MTSRRQTQIVAIVLAGLALAAAAAALILVVLDDDTGAPEGSPVPAAGMTPSPAPTVTLTPDGEALTPQGWTRCDNDVDRYSVAYPEDWVTVAPDERLACRFFDRGPFEVPDDDEFPLTDLVAHQTEADFQEVVDGFSGSARLVSSEPTEVDRYAAIVLETEATGDGLHPEGTRTYAYVIDRTGRAFVVRTTVPPDADDFLANTRVVDQAVETLRLP